MRRSRDQLFNKNDFNRLVDAARAKDLPIYRINATRFGLTLVTGAPKDDGRADSAGVLGQRGGGNGRG